MTIFLELWSCWSGTNKNQNIPYTFQAGLLCCWLIPASVPCRRAAAAAAAAHRQPDKGGRRSLSYWNSTDTEDATAVISIRTSKHSDKTHSLSVFCCEAHRSERYCQEIEAKNATTNAQQLFKSMSFISICIKLRCKQKIDTDPH